MGYCKRIQTDCIYTDRDNNDNCSLNECKFMKEISNYNNLKDGSFTIKNIKTNKTNKIKGAEDNGKQ